MDTIEHFATLNDAVLIWDKDDDVAIQRRLYDDEGRQVARYRPDPCWFFPVETWLKAIERGKAEELLC